jgi:hypothetical protein
MRYDSEEDEDDDSDDPENPLESDMEDVADGSSDTATCPSCGDEIYEDVEQCPHCGHYVSSSGLAGRISLWMVIGTIICLLIIALDWLWRVNGP